jgi:hypothetical protein
MRMGEQDGEAADEQSKKAERKWSVGETNQRGMAGRIESSEVCIARPGVYADWAMVSGLGVAYENMLYNKRPRGSRRCGVGQ